MIHDSGGKNITRLYYIMCLVSDSVLVNRKSIERCMNYYCIRYSSFLEDYWPCAGGLSAVNAIGAQLRDTKNSGAEPIAVGGIDRCLHRHSRGKRGERKGVREVFVCISLTADEPQRAIPGIGYQSHLLYCNVAIQPSVVTQNLPISPRFSLHDFFYRDASSASLTTRQPYG